MVQENLAKLHADKIVEDQKALVSVYEDKDGHAFSVIPSFSPRSALMTFPCCVISVRFETKLLASPLQPFFKISMTGCEKSRNIIASFQLISQKTLRKTFNTIVCAHSFPTTCIRTIGRCFSLFLRSVVAFSSNLLFFCVPRS